MYLPSCCCCCCCSKSSQAASSSTVLVGVVSYCLVDRNIINMHNMCQERMHHGFTMQLLPHKFSHSNQHSSCCLLFRICWVERSIVSMHVPGGYTMGLPLWIAHVVSHWLINCTTHSTAMSANPSHSYADAQKNKSFHSSE
jgi:hypothetical protein